MQDGCMQESAWLMVAQINSTHMVKTKCSSWLFTGSMTANKHISHYIHIPGEMFFCGT